MSNVLLLAVCLEEPRSLEVDGGRSDQLFRLRTPALRAEWARFAPEGEDCFKVMRALWAAEIVSGHVGDIVSPGFAPCMRGFAKVSQ